jgi:hypothetical protein
MEVLLDDLRYALRSFRRSPAFAAVAVLSIGLAIGADTAVFSVVDALFVRPLPFADSSRLVSVRGALSSPEMTDLREQARTLEKSARMAICLSTSRAGASRCKCRARS